MGALGLVRAASLSLADMAEPGLNQEPLVLLDRDARVASLNQAAADLLRLSPSLVLTHPASSLPSPWGDRLANPGLSSPWVTWEQRPEGWTARLRPVLAPQPARLLEGLRLSGPSPALLSALLSPLHGGEPWGLWVRQGSEFMLACGTPDGPSSFETSDSLAVQIGRPGDWDGAVLTPLPGWTLPCESIPLMLGDRVGLLYVAESVSPGVNQALEEIRLALLLPASAR